MMQFEFSICREWKDILDSIKTDILLQFGRNEFLIEEETVEDRCFIIFKFFDPLDYTSAISAILYRSLSQSMADKYKAYYIKKAQGALPQQEWEDFAKRASRIRVIQEEKETIKALEEMLDNGKTIAVDAFFRFVMRTFKQELKRRISMIAEDVLISCQYMEFINLMRDYMDSQPHTSCVHIYSDDNDIALLNDELQELDQDELCHDEPVTPEDRVLSALLTVSPEQVVIHAKDEDKPIIKTIKRLFTGKLDFPKK